MSTRILLVEDDEKLGRQIVEHLTEAGLEASWLRDGATAMGLTPQNWALLILDLMLPGAYGLDILKHWRSQCDVPVLVLSAKQDAAVKVRALELGADDYMTKPFWPEELVARVQARLRRPVLARADRVECGSIVIDVTARRTFVNDVEIELTKVEFDLLHALAMRPGAAIARSWLVQNVLPPDREGTERTLDVHVSRVRRKLGTAGAQLATVWGIGYRLKSEESG